MIPIADPVEALFILTKHALSMRDVQIVSDEYIHDWARWTIEETHDSLVEHCLQTPLCLNFFGNFLDVSHYEEIYGTDRARILLESEAK